MAADESNPWDLPVAKKIDTPAKKPRLSAFERLSSKLASNVLHNNNSNLVKKNVKNSFKSKSRVNSIANSSSSIQLNEINDPQPSITSLSSLASPSSHATQLVSITAKPPAFDQSRRSSTHHRHGSFLGKQTVVIPQDNSPLTSDPFPLLVGQSEKSIGSDISNDKQTVDMETPVSSSLFKTDPPPTNLVENASAFSDNNNYRVGKENVMPVESNSQHPITGQQNKISSRTNQRSSGSLPTKNYIKLNLRKKCFSKKGSLRQRALQRKVRFTKFKKRFNADQSESTTRCFRCGQEGHWAKKCPGRFHEKIFNQSDTNHVTSSDYELALASARGRMLNPERDLDPRYSPASLDDLRQALAASHVDRFQPSDLDLVKTEMAKVAKQLGYSVFRPGQQLVCLRILCGLSTLAVMPTAGGKSLCYQLPAYMYQRKFGSLALIISPLIALMQDQLTTAASTILEGAFINSSQSVEDKHAVLDRAAKGELAFLMLAPEALVQSDWLLGQANRLPPISFACIDEAHCLADWSHHFRPSYLRVCSLLRNCLGVKCFLGLSATCTTATIDNVCRNLGIADPSTPLHRLDGALSDLESVTRLNCFVQTTDSPIPGQLTITASLDTDRDQALLALLTRPPFCQLTGGILIYCAMRDQTERLASFIRTALQETVDKVGRRRLAWTTAAYHAGQSARERSRVQKRFMTGRVRVLLATSAFGMGLNKADLQAVIHYSLTTSFESYIQEIGRVGRRQQVACYCHAFLPRELVGARDAASEANELRRHVFANHVDPVLVKRLVNRLLVQPSSSQRHASAVDGHALTIDPNELGLSLDVKVESLETLLAYLELNPTGPLITMLRPGCSDLTVDCYGGCDELAYATERCLAVAASVSLKSTTKPSSQVNIDLVQLTNRWGWLPSRVRQELRSLEWGTWKRDTDQAPTPFRTNIRITSGVWCWWLWIHHQPRIRQGVVESEGESSSQRLDACINYLNTRLARIEAASLDSIARLTRALVGVAGRTIDEVYPLLQSDDGDYKVKNARSDLEVTTKTAKTGSDALHVTISDYFASSSSPSAATSIGSGEVDNVAWPPPVTDGQLASLNSTIRELISVHGRDAGPNLTGRSIANILHGIPSPQFPALTWSRCRRYWRAHLDIDWPRIKALATEQLMLHHRAF